MIPRNSRREKSSLRWQNDRTVKLPCRYTNNRAEKVVEKKRKGLNPVSKKGLFWIFVNRVLDRFFLIIELRQVCESCEGTAHCGPLTPAHTRRRQDIPRGDWWYAFRVACLGSDCHLRIDSMGRRRAEPIIEKIIRDRFKKLGMPESKVKALLLECAEYVKAEDAKQKHPRFTDFNVEFPDPVAPFEIDLEDSVWIAEVEEK